MNLGFISSDPNLAEFFYKNRQDPVTIRYNPLTPSTVDELRVRLTKACSDLSKFAESESFLWFINCDNETVGSVSLHSIDKKMLTAEIGYTLAASARGRGIATWAVRELTKNVFTQTPIRKLTAYVHEENIASYRVLEKSGYKREGFLREHFLVNGSPVNEILFGILRREFLQENLA
jgi:[ribosomal protein S5]-alanine N-acetyltransferase